MRIESKNNMKLFGYYLLQFFLMTALKSTSAERVPSIAIIGGGIGGTGACYYARKAFNNANVFLLEPEDIGGRIKSVSMGGNTFEVGAYLIAEACQYTRDLLQTLKIQHSAVPTDAINNLYNGKESVFQMASDSSAMFSLLWQYGFGLSDIVEYLKELDKSFTNIYLLQNHGYAFSNLTSMLRALDKMGTHTSLLSMMGVSATNVFAQKEFSEEFLRQVVQSLEYRTYGQSVDTTNFFAATLSLSAAIGGEITAIRGSTAQLPEKLLEQCNSKVIKSRVAKLVKEKINDIVTFSLYDDNAKLLVRDIDLVIIAAPQVEGKSKLYYEHAQLAIPFTSYYTTIVQGELNHATFDFATTALDQIHNVFSYTATTKFYSIERLHDVEGQLPKDGFYYKVVSHDELSADDLSKLFINVRSTHVQKWDVAPNYKSSLAMFESGGNDELTRFEVDENVFYVTPIELMRSAMEYVLVSARNAVLLARNSWYKTQSRTDKLDFADDSALLKDLASVHTKEEL